VKLGTVGYGYGPLFGKLSLLSTVKIDLKWLFKILALPAVLSDRLWDLSKR